MHDKRMILLLFFLMAIRKVLKSLVHHFKYISVAAQFRYNQDNQRLNPVRSFLFPPPKFVKNHKCEISKQFVVCQTILHDHLFIFCKLVGSIAWIEAKQRWYHVLATLYIYTCTCAYYQSYHSSLPTLFVRFTLYPSIRWNILLPCEQDEINSGERY